MRSIASNRFDDGEIMKRLLLLLVVVACAGVGVMRAQHRRLRSGELGAAVLRQAATELRSQRGQVDPKVAFFAERRRSLF